MVKIKGGMNKNYGLIIDERKPEDWIMGGTGNLKGVVLQENGQWDEFLPLFEAQYNPVETFACASFGTLNAIEILLKRMFGYEENYSDRFLAKVSGTDPKIGNSPQTVAEYLRKIGVPLQSKWDFTPDIDTSEKFYAPIPAKLFDYAKEDFTNKFIFKHQYVNGNPEDIKAALRYSPVAISVTAWYEEDGVFVQRGTDNHWVVCYGYDDAKQAYKVFDSYNTIYSGESKFEKKLYSYSANIAIAKSYFIEKSNLENLLIKQVGLLQLLKIALEKLLAIFKQPELPKLDVPTPIEPAMYLWGTRDVARYSCRMIMDEWNLEWKEKDLLCAVIEAESGFKINAKNENKKNGKVVSTDWGICQINDYYHIGKGKSFASVDEVLNQPEKSVRFLVRQYKAGNLNWWIAYRNGSYRKFL